MSRLSEDDERALFMHHREAWANYQAKVTAAEKIGIAVKAALKADGFTVGQMRIADEMGNVKGEKRVTDQVVDRLKVARWIGHAMGRQLSLFIEPDRTPAIERAYEDGKTAGYEGRPRVPPFDPNVPQYDQWMNGWYAGQEALLATGIQPTQAAPAEAAPAADPAAPADPAAAPAA